MKNLRNEQKKQPNIDLTIEVSDVVPQLKKSLNYLNGARYKQAIRELNLLLDKNLLPLDQLTTLAMRAKTNLLWGKYKQAIDDISDAWQLFLPPKSQDFDLIDWKQEHQRNDGYLEFFGALLNMKAMSYFAIEKYEKALSDLNLAIDMVPPKQHHFSLYFNRAICLIAQKMDKVALEDLNQSLELNAEKTLALLNIPTKDKGKFVYKDKTLFYQDSQDHPVSGQFESIKNIIESLIYWAESPHGKLE